MRATTIFLSRKFMITHLSIAFEDFLGSSLAPQVMPPWYGLRPPYIGVPNKSWLKSKWAGVLSNNFESVLVVVAAARKGGEGFFCIVQCCGAEQNVMPPVPVRAARGSCGRDLMEAVEGSGGRDPMEEPPLTLSGAKQRSLSRFSLKRVFFFTQHIPFSGQTKKTKKDKFSCIFA